MSFRINALSTFPHVIDQLSQTLFLAASLKLVDLSKHLTIVGSLSNSNNAAFIVNECFRNVIPEEKTAGSWDVTSHFVVVFRWGTHLNNQLFPSVCQGVRASVPS